MQHKPLRRWYMCIYLTRVPGMLELERMETECLVCSYSTGNGAKDCTFMEPASLVVKNLPAKRSRHKRHRLDPWIGKICWRRKWQSTPVFLPRKFHRHGSLVGYSPWDCKESDIADPARAHTHTLPMILAGDWRAQGISIPRHNIWSIVRAQLIK